MQANKWLLNIIAAMNLKHFAIAQKVTWAH